MKFVRRFLAAVSVRARVAFLIALGIFCGSWGAGSVVAAWNDVTDCGSQWFYHPNCQAGGGWFAGDCWEGHSLRCQGGVKMTAGAFAYFNGMECRDAGGTVVACPPGAVMGGNPQNVDNCDCTAASCAGECQWFGEWSDFYNAPGTLWFVGSNCNGVGCGCSVTPAWQLGSFTTPCTNPDAGCTGTCNWWSVNAGGEIVWSLTDSDCSAGCNCECPFSAPLSTGEGVTTTCVNVAIGTCPSTPAACTGSCQYVSTSDGQGGFSWAYDTSNCEGASPCECPSSPGGQCPTATGQNTSIACGSTGGPCTPGTCAGNCNYTAVASEDGKTFSWVPGTNNCTPGASNCNCPSDPGGDCPTSAEDTKSVACGSASTPCKTAKCSAHGGDADRDGCCKDEDLDDADAAVCSSDCKGFYTRCTRHELAEDSPLVDCDPLTAGPLFGWSDCTCSRVPNGDRDKDKCCDAADKWPDDPKKGCPCCDYEEAWNEAGGDDLYLEWKRIFGNGYGPIFQFVEWDGSGGTGTGAWRAKPVQETLSMPSMDLPLGTLTGGRMSDMPIYLPVTVEQAESLIRSRTGKPFTAGLVGASDLVGWWRLACAWVVGVSLLTALFQEMRT